MYPLVNWTYDQLCERLTLLKANHLYPELVVVSAQLIEQVIKRHIMREMNLQRRHWVVHGTHSPRSNEIECLGVWGAEAITRILCPDQGWQQCLRWNAQEKMPAFQTHSTKS